MDEGEIGCNRHPDIPWPITLGKTLLMLKNQAIKKVTAHIVLNAKFSW